MRTISFPEWLEHRVEKVPDIGNLALLIAHAGAAGVSREGLSKALGIPGETLEVLLRAMVAAGQVVVLKANGQIVYRATT
jgi:hypothetical protein